MNKKTNKILAACLSAVMLLSASPVMAAPVIQEIGEGNAKTDVYLNIDDTNIIAGVPTTIIVDGKANENVENIGEYSVSAHGDIAGNKELTIAPESNEITLTQKGKADVTASITQDQTVFSSEDLANGASSNGKVSATLTAGSWKGSTNFVISMNTLLMPGYTTLYEYDLSATTDDDVKAYYMVPNKNTSAVEVETEPVTGNMNMLSTISNLVKPMTAYAADNTVIEHNGIRYELSDKDVLVISGQGKMKENIQADLFDFAGLQKAVEAKFNAAPYIENSIWTKPFGNPHDFQVAAKSGLSAILMWYEYDVYPVHAWNSDCIKEQLCSDGTSIYACDNSCTEVNGAMMHDDNPDLLNEINSYIDSITDQYIVSLPKSVIVNNGVTNISNKAFSGCKTLQNVILPETVEAIGNYAFYNCTDLNEINFPNSIISIGNSAFQNCSRLGAITLPDNLKSIGSCAFMSCRQLTLTDAKIPNSVTSIGNGAFQNCNNLSDITLGKGLTELENNVFHSCTGLKSITIPNNITKMGSSFSGCTGLTYVEIPNGVVSLSSTFSDCKNLENIIIPDSVTTLSGTFSGCTGLNNIDIPNSVTSIGQYTFRNCSALTSVVIPNGVKTIGIEAFSGCSNLMNLKIPASVATINRDAFSYLPYGATIYCETQNVANLTSGKYDPGINIIVAPELFA